MQKLLLIREGTADDKNETIREAENSDRADQQDRAGSDSCRADGSRSRIHDAGMVSRTGVGTGIYDQ